MNSYLPKNFVTARNARDILSNYILTDGLSIIFDNNYSSLYRLQDAISGKVYVDFFTCFASIPIGYNHPKMISEDYVQYIGRNALNKPSNSDLYSEVMATFVKTLFETGDKNKHFKYSFFIEGGALAVENALKTAFDWKVKKNFLKYKNKKELGHKVIHFKEAFHGRSGYTLSLTNTDPNKVDLFPKFEWPRVTNPKIDFDNETILNHPSFFDDEELALKEINNYLHKFNDDIAAIIIEPIQGEGGDNHFRGKFLNALRKVADENDVLLIFDEIQTGTGITGKFWCYEHFNVIPDILCFGKKMQVCGILSTNRIDDIDDHVFRKSGRINSTWGGNYTDMARATKYLEIIDEENLLDNASSMGNYLLKKIISLKQLRPDLIKNSRGKGLFAAFDFIGDQRKEFLNQCFDQGLIILASGKNSIRFRPALNITKDSIDEGFEIMEKVIKKL